MSDDMMSQDSDEYNSQSEDDVDDNDYYYHDYGPGGDDAELDMDGENDDPEYFDYTLLTVEDVERLLNESVEYLSKAINVTPSLAKMVLHNMKWMTEEAERLYKQDSQQLLADCNIIPEKGTAKPNAAAGSSFMCPVCMQHCPQSNMLQLPCSHPFCRECWQIHFQVKIQEGVSTGLECMQMDCNVLVPEDFVMKVVTIPKLRERYTAYTFNDYVESHPELRFCPGPNCTVIVRAMESKAKRVECKHCLTSFCFKCGIDYHAPTACATIKKWLTKCADDSETANYISAHTKDCPKCHVCIEKNGGCNHMQCTKCKHDFCWMCLGDWKAHGSEYYECSRYKENPNIATESVHAQAREALKKYLFYFERWENHAKSLKLEEQTLRKIKERIEEKVMKNSGTWIDWQYLLQAAQLLKKCRYTLQYTYPYAYYLERGSRKELFEYQQAQLEAEVENLSWKVERAEITDRGDLENQMDVAEKRRLTLVRDFLGV